MKNPVPHGRALVVHRTEGRLATATAEELLNDPFANRGLRALPRAFLRAYVKTKNVDQAAELVNCSSVQHYHWLKRGEPNYADAWDDAQFIVKEKFKREFLEKVEGGLTSRMYDGKGQLKMVMQKQDGGLVRLHMQAAIPDEYGYREAGAHTQVQVNVVFKDE